MNPAVITLVLTIMMPPNVADIQLKLQESSIETCLSDSKEFLDHGVPEAAKDAIGVAALCLVPKGASGDDL
jgi:hypothetical protein